MTLPPNHSVYDALFRAAERFVLHVGLTRLHLKAQAIQESGLVADAVSRAGAKGLMQFMPATGAEFSLLKDADFFDPAKNVDAGAAYMARLCGWISEGRAFKAGKLAPVKNVVERWHFALAAYNCGIGNVVKAVERSRAQGLDPSDYACVSRFLDGNLFKNEQAWKEPVLYVARIKKYHEMLQDDGSSTPGGALRTQEAA